LPFYLLYTGCSSFGAVSRAKSVLSGADSAGAGSMEVVEKWMYQLL
jgi:hypothetical protein